VTSGPMPINALPPEQPDPQVVAWMRAYRSNLPEHLDLVSMRLRTIKAYRGAHPECDAMLADLGDAYREAALKPLTRADIPAGQGGASLYIATDGRRLSVWFKRRDGHAMHLITDPGPHATAADAALWEHLAATLPTVAD
jgi:hypothetical protein